MIVVRYYTKLCASWDNRIRAPRLEPVKGIKPAPTPSWNRHDNRTGNFSLAGQTAPVGFEDTHIVRGTLH